MSAHRIAAQLHREIEQTLADRVPGALTPRVRGEFERLASGVEPLDTVLRGGLCIGAITELTGPECSGRTSMAQAYAAATIQHGNVAAWVDVEDRLDPVSAAEAGVDWTRLLWIRCGERRTTPDAPLATTPPGQSLTPGPAPSAQPVQDGGSPHPRAEGHGMSRSVEALLAAQPRSAAIPDRRRNRIIGTPGAPNRPLTPFTPIRDREEQIPTDRRPSRHAAAQIAARFAEQPASSEPRCAEPQPRPRARIAAAQRQPPLLQIEPTAPAIQPRRPQPKGSWTPLDQALRATDLLLQTGGFAMIVLDLGSTPAEMSWRIPLATWFRFRAASARTRTALLVLTQHPCARSSAGLSARLEPGTLAFEGRVMTGLDHRAEVQRARFKQPVSNVVPIRKPPQPVSPYQRPHEPGRWKGAAPWAI